MCKFARKIALMLGGSVIHDNVIMFPVSLRFPKAGFCGCFRSDPDEPPSCIWCWVMPSSSWDGPKHPHTQRRQSWQTELRCLQSFPSSSQPYYQLCSHKKSFQHRICFPSHFPEETRGPRGSQKWRMLLEPHCQGAGKRTWSLTAHRSHISCTI